jgi:hypothetical protein
MSKQNLKKLIVNFTTLILLLACFFIISNSQPEGVRVFWWQSPQDTQDPNRKQARTLVTRPSDSDPFEILDINREGAKIKPYMQFEESGDWLRNMRFKIKNRSESPIVALRIGLAFPEASRNKSDSLMVYVIDLGHKPNSPAVQGRLPIFLIQNDVLTYEVTEKHLTNIDQFLAKRGFSSGQMTNVELRMMEVYFANGLAWIGGSMMEPDRTTPGRYNRVKP